eukprot:g1600.t1
MLGYAEKVYTRTDLRYDLQAGYLQFVDATLREQVEKYRMMDKVYRKANSSNGNKDHGNSDNNSNSNSNTVNSDRDAGGSGNGDGSGGFRTPPPSAMIKIDDVKKAVTEKWGIPAAAQCLAYAGNQLLDGRTLSEYRIQHEGTLHLTIAADEGGAISGGSSRVWKDGKRSFAVIGDTPANILFAVGDLVVVHIGCDVCRVLNIQFTTVAVDPEQCSDGDEPFGPR